MYIPLIFFITSFLAIIFMVLRKISALREMELPHEDKEDFEIPFIREVGEGTVKGVKKYGHAGVVMGVRMYVKSSNTIKNSYEKAKERVQDLGTSNKNGEKKEISKFLKVVGDYKRKIVDIKHKIRQEEEEKL